jgi:hypothetical protein
MKPILQQTTLSLFLLLVSLVGHTQARVYENKLGNYKISIPANWKERVEETTTDIFVPDEGELDAWQEFVGISLSESNGLSLNDVFAYYIKEDFPGYYQNFKIVKQGQETINGQNFKWVLYSFSNSSTPDAAILYNLFYLTLKKDMLYSLNAISEKSGYAKLEPAFLNVIRSFQLNQ